MSKRKQRRGELRRITTTLRRLSRQPIPRMRGEARVRRRMRRHILRERRYGIDAPVVRALTELIDSHVTDIRAEILRQQAAEAAALGELDARLHGLVVRYGEQEQHQHSAVEQLREQRHSALRRVAEPDTPQPWGPGGVEERGVGHGNIGELVGRNIRVRVLLWTVLCLAMVADLIAFRQVVERVLNESRYVLPMVVALTGATTYLAHLAGGLFKSAKEAAGRSIRQAFGGWTTLAIWAGMGLTIFVFRLLAPPPASGATVQEWGSVGGFQPDSANPSPVLSALLLLVLYILTGAIAIAAGYQRPRVEIEQHRRANRALRKAEPRLVAIRQDAAEAEALRQRVADLRIARWGLYAVELDRCAAVIRRLKAEASMLIQRLRRSTRLPWLRSMIGGRAADGGAVTDVTDVIDVIELSPPAAAPDDAGLARDAGTAGAETESHDGSAEPAPGVA